MQLSTFALSDEVNGQTATWKEESHVGGLDDRALFVIGNTLFTVYHELGHGLVDMLNLPVIGREEDAVDGFAAVTMIPETPDEVRDALIVAVADSWRAQSDLALDNGVQPYWGEHALDQQRYFAIVCLMVGSDQDGFYDFALEAGLPDARIETCIHDFARMTSGWKRLLEPHRPDAETGETLAGPSINVVFDRPLSEQERVFDLIREGGLLENTVLGFDDEIALPSPVTVRFTACDNANAYWSRSQREVVICYELIDEFDAIAMGAVVR